MYDFCHEIFFFVVNLKHYFLKFFISINNFDQLQVHQYLLKYFHIFIIFSMLHHQ